VSDIPADPAAYVRVADATSAGDPNVVAQLDLTLGWIRDMGWPAPTAYTDAGEPGRQLAALMDAISSGHHDAVFALHPITIGDLAQIQALDLLCRQHAVRLLFRRGTTATYPRALFDVIRNTQRFTVTDEHLQLLRSAYVWWDDLEFGAPGINPKRPYGNSNVYGDIAQILGIPDSEWMSPDAELIPDAQWRFLRLHVETAIALQIALATGEFRTGRYVREDPHGGPGWKLDEAR
jgi:hypothetical protein